MKIIDQGDVKFFLTMQINYDLKQKRCTIAQPLYIQKLLEEYNMENCNIKSTPLCPSTVIDKVDICSGQAKYMQNVPYVRL